MKKRLIVLTVLFMLIIPVFAQANALTQRHEFNTGHALRYPPNWELEETTNGIILRSQRTVLQVIVGIPAWYEFDELMTEYGRGYFQAQHIRYYSLADSRDAARAEYRDDEGDGAMDLAIQASNGVYAYFVALSYSGDLAERETVLAIAASYDDSRRVEIPRESAINADTVGSTALGRLTVPFLTADYGAGTYLDAPCPFYVLPPEIEGTTLQCGYLIVLEEHNNPYSPTIQLAVMKIYSPDPYAPADPIIYLEGGPGGSALSRYDGWLTSGLRTQRDIILIDQRGTGFSRPSLNCIEYNEYSYNPAADCLGRLRTEGINLAAFNSYENAADITDLITALGLEQANLMGTSYGSRLALTILRDHPEKLRSVLIEGVFPPTANAYEQQARHVYRAFDTLFTNCSLNAACNAAYPNLRPKFYQAVRALNERPLSIYSEYYGQDVYITGEIMIDQIFALMYSSLWISYMPALIEAAYNYDSEAYLAVEPPPPSEPERDATYDSALEVAFMDYTGKSDLSELHDYLDSLSDYEYYEMEDAILGRIDGQSEGMFNSVTCREEVPFNTLAGYNRESESLPAEIRDSIYYNLNLIFNYCEVWDVPAANARENQAVASALPVLLFSGEYDPITPPEWADLAASSLTNARHFVMPSLGHGVVDVHPCPTQIALAFFADPSADLDTSCIAGMQSEFYTP